MPNRTAEEWNRFTADEKRDVLAERLENNWCNGSDVRNLLSDLEAMRLENEELRRLLAELRK